MAIRLWLLTADCWQCGASIELTLEQEREIRRRLAQRTAAKAAPKPQPKALPKPATLPTPQAPPVQERPVPPSHSAFRAADPPALVSWQRDLLACLASSLFHALLILLLGLWTLDAEPYESPLILSVTLSHLHRTGGDPAEVEINPAEYELPVEEEPKNEAEREALFEAKQVARELRLDPGDAAKLPPLERVKEDLKSSDPLRRMQASRDPRVRAEIVRREGGTLLTEAAVARGLRWIAAHQADDGGWGIHDFNHNGDCGGRCRGVGALRSHTAGTALALMAMLGTGQTHEIGIYRENVERGLAWLVREQKPNGDLRGDSQSNAGMYAHALAAIALCDAYKMTGDAALREPAQRATDFICEAQHPNGGWRYRPGAAGGDMSVIGWQLMALHSARSASLHVPARIFDRAARFLNRLEDDEREGRYVYRPGENISPTMTSAGLLSRMYLGAGRDNPALARGVTWLLVFHLPGTERDNVYYWYYATQVMHHWGGEPWEQWNRHMRTALIATQTTSGHAAGSWPPSLDPFGPQGGRLYTTALAVCTLEVYYRYAPLYRRIDLGR
jgi:hypothetical protein